MHRARLADKAGAKLFEHPIGIGKDLEEAMNRIRIVGRMTMVLRKRNRVRQFVRHVLDRDDDPEFCKSSHNGLVKTGYRVAGQRELPPRAVACEYPQQVIDQIKIDLKRAVA